jgi:hypothetical protein
MVTARSLIPQPSLLSPGESEDASAAKSGFKEQLSVSTGNSVIVNSRCPVWDPRLDSLAMGFMGGRLVETSAKNFLFEYDVLGEAEAQATSEREKRAPCLQFGKQSFGRYACDFRFPLCALQTFGIFLTTFAWDA